MKTLLISACLVLAGCTTLPPAPAPHPLPDTRAWWLRFGSPELPPLVAQAQAHSPDTAATLARIRQAQARSHSTGADAGPQFAASLARSRSGTEGGLQASYGLDLWGRQPARQDAAQARLHASQWDHHSLHLAVSAQVASAWLQVLGLGEQQRLAAQHLATAQRLLQLVAARARAGAASPLELAQQQGLVASQQRSMAALAQQQAHSLAALAVLLGQEDLPQLRGVWADLRVPEVAADLPSDLLARRPDIARAEAQLAAAHAQVAVARAALFPALTLSASLSADSLAGNPLRSLVLGLAAPIWDADRLAAGHALALAERDELLAQYRAAIVAAWGDARSALHTVAGLQAQASAQAEALAHAQRALQLAESRYRAGADTALVLLEAQRSLAQAQDGAAQLHLARLQAAVGLYRALGGGWGASSS